MRVVNCFRPAVWLGCAVLATTLVAAAQADEPPQTANGEGQGKGDLHIQVDRRYTLGTKLTAVPKVLDEHLRLDGKGALVAEILADGPAEHAGLKVNDVLLSINGTPVADLGKVVELLNASEGKEVSLELIRAGEHIKVNVQPDAFKHRADELEIMLDGNVNLNEIISRIGELDSVKINELERKIREKLRNSGAELRMQFIQPGHILSDRIVELNQKLEHKLPDDLDIRIHKHGNEPAEIEVKEGDKTWTATANDLDKLPAAARTAVESTLSRVRGKIVVDLPGGQKFFVAVPPPPALPAAAGEIAERVRRESERLADKARAEVARHRDAGARLGRTPPGRTEPRDGADARARGGPAPGAGRRSGAEGNQDESAPAEK